MKHTIGTLSKLQIEAHTTYPLDRAKRVTVSSVETYVFVPKSLGINLQTYPKYLFYRDLQTYAELELRPSSLERLAAADGEPLQRLRRALENPSANTGEKRTAELETECRLFLRLLDNTIEDHVDRVGHQPAPQHLPQLLATYLQAMQGLSTEFRSLRSLLARVSDTEEHRSVLLLGDEYLSLLIEQSSYELLEATRKGGPPEIEPLRRDLLALARAEQDYRRAEGYDSVPSSKHHHETLVYRRSALRRYAQSILFLSTRHQPEGRLIRELLLSLAAGVAMVFATAVTFLAHVQYENWTTSFFVILVISYMFKDRLKALVQASLQTSSQRLFYDYKTRMYGEGGGGVLGFHRESIGFVDADDVDPQVMHRRNRDRLDELDDDFCGENILLYKKKTGIYAARVSDTFQGYPIEGINEILHFDLTRFARKMEDAKQTVYETADGGYRKTRGQRVYYLNMVVKWLAEEGAIYRRFRIVMSRNGIRRIERFE